MSIFSRFSNLFRGDRLTREIDDEIQTHLAEAVEHGRDATEARRSFGAPLQIREQSRDIRILPWLDSLRADSIFAWRRMLKKKAASAAAILSLALAIGACTSAFRLIDALLLRPLPVANPERLHSVAFENIGANGKLNTYDSCSYPMFQRMRAAVKESAESIAVSYAERAEVTYGSEQELEGAYRQYVSGWMFPTFGLRPAAGRLLTEDDDATIGKHPVVVLSYDYWTRRFARDSKVVGRTVRMGDGIYQIVGVGPDGFTGTETGTVTDIFVPMMMKIPTTLTSATNFWLRTLVQLKPGIAVEPVREQLRATFRSIQEERAKGFTGMSKLRVERFLLEQSLKEKLLLEPAAAGRSNMQRDYRRSLIALGILVALVLLIACANVANLMTAQAAARAREMALRVSIGAGRWRLVQLVLIESAWLALLATAAGGIFAWWSAPFILGMISSPDTPARLALPADLRVLGFALSLALIVTFLFGLAPALRASSVKPVSALKGGDDPHARPRLMHALVAVQVAFCVIVHFVAGLFIASFDRLSNQATGFSAERILNLETVTQRPQAAVFWQQVMEHLRVAPGVETVALTTWPLMSGESNVGAVSIDGGPPSEALTDLLNVSPGWFDEMRVPLLDGRDFTANDSGPGVAIVNQAFANQYFEGRDPVGKSFDTGSAHVRIVGFVRDARSRDDLRLPIRPIAYRPFPPSDSKGAPLPMGRGTFVVRTASANPLALASILRQEIPRARPEFHVRNIRTQVEIERSKTIRERLLAMLAMFFATVALLLAGVGLYGVLDFLVLQRRREIGIRIAVGARTGDIARRVTADVFAMVLAGAAAGMALGITSVRYIEALLFQVKPGGFSNIAMPLVVIFATALLASLPAIWRAARIDPVSMLRAD
uniref:Permease n=1 Tax=Solibacter usitatus (strain Ellin6076) TaxID=234267 RepID=Q01QP7_SOLUE